MSSSTGPYSTMTSYTSACNYVQFQAQAASYFCGSLTWYMPGCGSVCSSDTTNCRIGTPCWQCADATSVILYNKHLFGTYDYSPFWDSSPHVPTKAPLVTSSGGELDPPNPPKPSERPGGEGTPYSYSYSYDFGDYSYSFDMSDFSMDFGSGMPPGGGEGNPLPHWWWGWFFASGCSLDDYSYIIQEVGCCIEQYTGGCLSKYNNERAANSCACPGTWRGDGHCDCSCINNGCHDPDCTHDQKLLCKSLNTTLAC